MKKSALLLIVFVLMGACEDESAIPQISEEIEELITEIDIDILTDIDIIEVEDVVFEEEVFTITEKRAIFNGGSDAWSKYLEENLTYPETKVAGVAGRVYLSFVVDKEGRVANPKLEKGIHPTYDQEALRVLVNSPNWIPAKQRGREVNSRVAVAITFAQAQ